MFGFNPRTHVGCDGTKYPISAMSSLFQSTHPRRVRPNAANLKLAQYQFQSTHPRRVRHSMGRHTPLSQWFQSTHPRRVRQNEWNIAQWNRQFQSTHPRRVRLHIQQKAEYQCAKIIILRKTAKKIRIKYHKRYIICKSLIFRRCETIDYFAIL